MLSFPEHAIAARGALRHQDSRTRVSQSHQDETTRATEAAAQGTGATPTTATTTPETIAQPETDGTTIGTGTSLALGCVAGTLLLIVIGLIYILILAIV